MLEKIVKEADNNRTSSFEDVTIEERNRDALLYKNRTFNHMFTIDRDESKIYILNINNERETDDIFNPYYGEITLSYIDSAKFTNVSNCTLKER